MGGGVVTVGRKTYAVGLYWENSPSGNVAQAAKDAAQQSSQGADCFAVRSGAKDGHVPQFGLVQASGKCKPGMPVFAACMANQQPGSWAGAFRLQEGTVVTVVRDDLIVPDGDLLYDNESDARDRLLQEIGFGGLQRIFAPESWSIPGADSMPVSLLLDKGVSVRLRPVAIPRSWYVGGALLAGLGGLSVFLAWFVNEQSAVVKPSNVMSRPLGGVPSVILPSKPEYPPPERVWEKKPFALDMLKACTEGLAKVSAGVAGWSLSSVKCVDGAISLSWAHSRGYGKFEEGFNVDDSVTKSTSTVRLPKLEARGPENLWKQADITKRYLEQNWGGRLARAPDDPPPPPPPNYKGEWDPPKPPWVKRSFTINVPDLPSSLPEYFDGVPGVIIHSITLTGGKIMTGQWVIEGVIYENRL